MTTINRILSLTLVLAMLLSMASIGISPTAVHAAEEPDNVVLTPDNPVEAVISEGGQIAYFTFTPDADGVYLFSSESDGDTLATLYDSDMNELAVDDDSGVNNDFSLAYNMTAGTVYIYAARFYNDDVTGSFTVTLIRSPLARIDVKPVSIIEMSDGSWNSIWNDEGEITGEYFYYYWENQLEFTLTFHDGTVVNSSGSSFEYNGIWHNAVCESDQSGTNPWTVGNTYTAKLTVMGVTAEVPVTITPSPVESITFDPVSVVAYSTGYWTTGYNPETGNYDLDFFYYNWTDCLTYTITFTDGTTMQCSGGGFEYNGKWQSVSFFNTQSSENQWQVGQTYEVSVTVMGIKDTVYVTVEQSPITAITVNPISIVEGTGGYIYETDTDDGIATYYCYHWWEDMEYTITFSDGSTQQFTGPNFEYDGITYNIGTADSQCVDSPWTGGNTYTASASVLGISTDVSITIEKSPIASIKFAPITLDEGIDGDWNFDWNDNTQAYDLKFFRYNWLDHISYTVTFNDGSTVQSDSLSFTYKGQTYYLEANDGQSYDNQWTGGNTYTVTLSTVRTNAQLYITIEASPIVSIDFDPLTVIENYDGGVTDEYNADTGNYDLSYFCYYWWQKLGYTVTFSDGTTQRVTARNFYHDGKYYSLEYNDGQSYYSPWTVGNTYDVSVTVADKTFTQSVSVVSSPVSKIEVNPISFMSNTHGGYISDWDPENQTDTPLYFRYSWLSALEYTITYTDGTVVQCSGSNFNHNEEYYTLIASDDQSYTNQWQAGNTYYATINALGCEAQVPITITGSPLASIEVEPISMRKNSGGDWFYPVDENAGSPFYYYYWWYQLAWTVTFTDGTTQTGTGDTLYYDGQEYTITKTNAQFDDHWTEGNTYTETITILGVSADVSITIEPSPISSIVFEPIILEECTNGSWAFGWNEETQAYEARYYHYYWYNDLRFTITFTDGTTVQGEWPNYEYDGVYYSFDWNEGQDINNQWTPGNTYTQTVSTMGAEAQVSITITPSTIESITFDPVTVIENFDGNIAYDYNEETGDYDIPFYYYSWINNLEYTVTFTDGTTQRDSGSSFIRNGTRYTLDWDDGQNHSSPWTVGNTYNVPIVAACGEYTVPVTVIPTPVSSVQFTPISIMSGTNGYFTTDWDPETQTETPEYFYYQWDQMLIYTITYTDGTQQQVYGPGFWYNGKWCNLSGSTNQDYSNQWQEGNTYYPTVSVLGYTTTVPVTITSSPIESIEVDPMSMYEGTQGYWSYSFDDETNERYDQYFVYQWWDYLSYTITFTDGSTYEGHGRSYSYNGEYYMLDHMDDQDYETAWGVGVHTSTISAMGVTVPVTITVLPSPVQSISLDPITLTKGIDGSWNGAIFDGEEQYYYTYNWWNALTGSITLTDGTVIPLEGLFFTYQDVQYDLTYWDNQSPTNLMEVNKTYTCKVFVMGVEAEVTITIADTPMESITFSPITMAENNTGYWFTYSKSQSEQDYFCYDWWNSLKYTVTFKDGSTATGQGTSFRHNGVWHSLAFFNDQSAENQLTVGSTYSFFVGVLGCECRVSVDVVKPESADGYQYLVEDGKAYITNCLLTDTVLSIPSTLAGYEVAGIRALNEALLYTEELIIPDSVKEVSLSLFHYFETPLKKLTVGSGITALYYDSLNWLDTLEEVNISENNSAYCSIDGVVYDKDVTTMLLFPYAHPGTHVIPDSVTDIELIFNDPYRYSGIAIQTGAGTPDYVTVDQVIYNKDMTTVILCSGAKTGSYVMPESVYAISPYAFMNCSLTDITVSPNVTELPSHAFAHCENLKTIRLPETLTTIGYCAFMECTALEEITIPAGVTTIENVAFAWCNALTDITFLGDMPEINESSFLEIEVTCHYPAGNDTWNENLMLDYSGKVTWVAYGGEVVAPTVSAKSFTLSFEDEILVNLYYTVSDLTYVTEHGMLVFYTDPGNPDYLKADAVYADGIYDPAKMRYMAQTDGIAAKQMGDIRYYAAYAKLSDGTCVYSQMYDYSPKKYSVNMLGKSSTSDKQKALCVAMLNYGAAAQTYFGYNTDSLMNTQLTEEQKALVIPYDSSLFTGTVPADSAKTVNFPQTLLGFSKKSATVSFEGAFSINYYFTPSEAVDGEMSFYYWTPKDYAAADVLTTSNASGVLTMDAMGDGRYWAQISGIAAKSLDQTYYVCGMYTDTSGRTYMTGIVSYSLSKYCMNNAKDGNPMQELAAATAMYGYYAAQYFA